MEEGSVGPGTAAVFKAALELTRRVERTIEHEGQNMRRRRAMILSWADEIEREMGYGEPEQPPRTAQIRQWWRDQGEPPLA